MQSGQNQILFINKSKSIEISYETTHLIFNAFNRSGFLLKQPEISVNLIPSGPPKFANY